MSKQGGEQTSLALSACLQYCMDNDILRRQMVIQCIQAFADFWFFVFVLSWLLSTLLSPLPSEAECCRSSGPLVSSLLTIWRSESLYLKHTVGEGVHPTGQLKTASVQQRRQRLPWEGPDRRDKVHPKKCVIPALDLRRCSLLLPPDPSASFSFFFAFFFYPCLLLPAHHFSLNTTLAYTLLSLPRLSLCLSQLPVCLILNPVEIGQAEWASFDQALISGVLTVSAHPDPTEDPTEPWSPGLGFKQASPPTPSVLPDCRGRREGSRRVPTWHRDLTPFIWDNTAWLVAHRGKKNNMCEELEEGGWF